MPKKGTNPYTERFEAYNKGQHVKLRAKPLSDGSYSLFLDTYIDGRRSLEYLSKYLIGNRLTDNDTIRKAAMQRDIRESELETGTTASRWKAKSDFKEYWRSLAKNKAQTWIRSLKAFDEFIPGFLPFTALDNRLITDFKDFLLKTRANNTAWLYLNILKSALYEAVKDNILLISPGRFVSIKKMETERPHLDQDEIAKLKATPCKLYEIKRAFLFSCYTGLRLSDIHSLDWDNINIFAESISIRQQKTKELLTIPLIPEARALLSEEPGAGKVFALPSNVYINKILKEWIMASGITKQITFHASRHTFAILGLEAGLNPNVLQKWLGHKVLTTTMVYAKMQDKILFAAGKTLSDHLGANGGKND